MHQTRIHFNTIALILESGMAAYNILRIMEQSITGGQTPRQKWEVKCRCLRTALGNMIMITNHVSKNALQLIIGLGRSYVLKNSGNRILLFQN